ncbi:MAG TPA: (2Fe-2S)-binding protein [Rhodocyclaceae bacterium]|jgi:bacterioferritin-associated ferredoxin|nr:(2Fe-2S)-binding protein [Rhodocyclaceae bacterium]
MIVCVCHGVSDREIKTAIKNGVNSVEALGASLGVGGTCGACRGMCGEMIEEHGCDNSCATFRSAFPVFDLTPVAA